MEKVNPSVQFPSIEEEILEFFNKNNIFQKSIDNRSTSQKYSFYDGPPFATGTPHYGHLLAGTIKDVVPRYYTMLGYRVERRFGWDCHGLPIEMLVEEELGLKGPLEVKKFGVDKFNEACRQSVLRFEKEWRKVTNRLGRWVDFDNDYKTMDINFMESVWWVFKQLWDKGLIYKGQRVMAYSWRLGTPLSNFEAGLNYKDTQDPSIVVKFYCPELQSFFLVWTTTPWTLPSNVALAVNPSFDYACILDNGIRYILLSEKVKDHFSSIVCERSFKGYELVGLNYEPLFDLIKIPQNEFKVYDADFVDKEIGTGIVHIAPCYGEEDFELGKNRNLRFLDLLDEIGNFSDEFSLCSGKNFKDADKDIIQYLRDKGFLFFRGTINHQYPFCYRSDTPLIYRVVDGWYVRVEEFRDKLMEANDKVYWVPDYVKHGRFGNWLAQAKDWNISRNRFWGNPIPVWKCINCSNCIAFGSRKELEEKSGQTVTDLHSHFVDKIRFRCDKCGNEMTRVPEVLDCWFESGSMPFAQIHYPFEKVEEFENIYPADFIAEGMDQTRGWFYTLLVLGTLLTGKAPYKNVVVNGIVLAEDGRKMSKRLKNYPDPMYIINTYGADALRIYLINSPVVRGDNLRFSESGVKETVRRILLPIWNAYAFFVNYAIIDDYKPSSDGLVSSPNSIDRWIISRTQSMIREVRTEMEQYRLYRVFPCVLDYIEDLTNFYIRRSRRRFWLNDCADKQNAYDTLLFCLVELVKVLAPFAPFLSEKIFLNLRKLFINLPESVHLCDFPEFAADLIDANLEQKINLVQKIIEAGRSLRARLNLKLRQPLRTCFIISRKIVHKDTIREFEDLLKDELNVKTVVFDVNEEPYVKLNVRPLTPVLGPKLGEKLKTLFKVLSQLSRDEIYMIEDNGFFEFEGMKIPSSELIIERVSLQPSTSESQGDCTIKFDTSITDDLFHEMIAREFINRVQKMRKSLDLDLQDRISITFFSSDEVINSVEQFVDYIKSETLAVTIQNTSSPVESDLIKVDDIENWNVYLKISKLESC
ncbi:MAG: isoleucine--tRNA ligase [Deltaproteobacteria bacterium]|nr:isoleucine--tRNA ligase [Deltaproteobacteria bacterium]